MTAEAQKGGPVLEYGSYNPRSRIVRRLLAVALTGAVGVVAGRWAGEWVAKRTSFATVGLLQVQPRAAVYGLAQPPPPDNDEELRARIAALEQQLNGGPYRARVAAAANAKLPPAQRLAASDLTRRRLRIEKIVDTKLICLTVSDADPIRVNALAAAAMNEAIQEPVAGGHASVYDRPGPAVIPAPRVESFRNLGGYAGAAVLPAVVLLVLARHRAVRVG
jgi:hypothetical protein